MIASSFAYFAHFYVIMLFSFSFSIIFISGKLNIVPAVIWICSNLLVALSIELFTIAESNFGLNFLPVIFLLNSAAPFIKFLALSYGWKWKRLRWFVIVFFSLVSIVPLVELDLLTSDLNKLLISAGSSAAIFSYFFAAIFNRYWSGFTGRILICIHFVLIFTMWALRVNESWQQNVLYLFADANKAPLSWLFFLAVVGCMGELSFILMLASRSQRYAQIKQRREERIRARSSSLSVEKREISRLLDEQRRLLETLTHEVRQPINNAQAALQNIMSDLRPEDGNQKNVRPIAKRIQRILDGITLSLSNAIVGATLIERRKAAELRDCDIVSIAQFALLDTPYNVRERIVVDFPAHDLVLPVDPILIRLALRNLLDNAAKFSPPGSAIKFSIALDETRFGVLISVSNCVPNSFAFEPYMLERGKRGHNDTTAKDGSGIGLYIFSEIAKIHGNEIVIEYAEPGKVTFGMLLSE